MSPEPRANSDDPAAPRPGVIILQLYPDGPDSMMHAPLRSEAVGEAMEVAFPNRLHGHQHRALDDAVSQGRSAGQIGAFIAREFGIEYQTASGIIALLHRLGMEYRRPKAIAQA